MSEATVQTPPPPPTGLTMPPLRAAGYIFAALMLGLTQQVGLNLIGTNTYQIQGELGATLAETNWLIAAYMAPNVSLSIALVKIRTQYGLRNFAEVSILCFLGAALLNLFASDLPSAMIVRFMSGVAAAPMTSLAFLYMIEPFPPQRKLTTGLSLALIMITLGASLTRLVSPTLLDLGGFHGLLLFEIGLAMIAFGCVYLFPLNPPPRAKVIGPLDIVSYLLIALGFGATAIALSLGRTYWWLEAPWLGWLLVAAAICLTLAAIIELHRDSPLIDIRWLSSPAMLHFSLVLLVFRVVLSEQTGGASNLFQSLGFQNDQTQPLYAAICLASLAGGLACAAWLKPGRESGFYAASLTAIMIGAWMDSRSTSLVRPHDLYLSQGLVALGAGLFLPPAMSQGLASAFKRGPNYILSFLVIFLSTQSLGGLFGSAIFGTFVTLRTSFHYSMVVEHMALSDPLVSQRVTQLGGSYGHILTDAGLAKAEGIALLAQQANREATVLAYNDAFLVVALIAGLALLGLLAHVALLQWQGRHAQPTPQPAS